MRGCGSSDFWRERPWTCLARLVAGVLALVALWAPSTTQASALLKWSQPVRVNNQPQLRDALFQGLSCPATSFCVGIDNTFGGHVLTSHDPTNPKASWSLAEIDPGHFLQSVSCPTVSLCVVGDADGRVFTSRDPAGGAPAWHADRSDELGGGIYSLSCPSSSLCFGGDELGQVLQSGSDPAGERWTPVRVVDDDNLLYGLSCPSISLCVAVDSKGNAITSTNPAGGAGAWKSARVDRSAGLGLLAVSCPSAGVCVAGDYNGNLLTTINPTGGAPAWRTKNVYGLADRPAPIQAIECPTTSMCVAVDRGGNALTSNGPGSSTAAWDVAPTPGRLSLTALACPSTKLCLAGSATGEILVGRPPPPPTAAQLVSSLRRQLTPRGPAARIPVLARRRGYGLRFVPLAPGRLRVDWYTDTVSSAAHVLVARGARRFATDTSVTLTIRVTRRGLSMLKRATSLRLTARGAFEPAQGGTTVEARQSFSLRR
jgi:hypothetical protein